MLVPVALLNYMDRQMLAAMKTSVMHDIPDIGTDANWGRMLGQFKWVYAFLSPVGGYLADRFGKRFTICGSLFVWSLVTWATGHVTSYESLLVARSLMGISEAFYIPAALALISEYHLGSTRSRAVGTHQMAIYVGVILGGFSGYVADAPGLGWRFAFDACGVVGMLYAIPLVFVLRDVPRLSSKDGAMLVKGPSPYGAVRELVTNPSFILLVLYFTLPALAGWVVRDWMPAVMKSRYHLDQGASGVIATSSWQLAAIATAIFGGWWADRRMRVNMRGRIHVSATGMCLIIPAIFGLGYADSLSAGVICLVVFGLGWGFFDCNNMPILCQIARPELRATGYGIMNLVSTSCGGLADWAFGAMLDHKIPHQQIFGTFAAAALISLIMVLLIKPRETR